MTHRQGRMPLVSVGIASLRARTVCRGILKRALGDLHSLHTCLCKLGQRNETLLQHALQVLSQFSKPPLHRGCQVVRYNCVWRTPCHFPGEGLGTQMLQASRRASSPFEWRSAT